MKDILVAGKYMQKNTDGSQHSLHMRDIQMYAVKICLVRGEETGVLSDLKIKWKFSLYQQWIELIGEHNRRLLAVYGKKNLGANLTKGVK